MKILLTTLVILTALTGGPAQDRDMETKFFNERDKIKENGIKEITERVFQEWKKSCFRDSAKLRWKYSFDKSGNLIQVDRYSYGGKALYTTIKYKRNINGRYYDREIVFLRAWLEKMKSRIGVTSLTIQLIKSVKVMLLDKPYALLTA